MKHARKYVAPSEELCTRADAEDKSLAVIREGSFPCQCSTAEGTQRAGLKPSQRRL